MNKFLLYVGGVVSIACLAVCAVSVHRIAFHADQPECGGTNASYVKSTIEKWVRERSKQNVSIKYISHFHKLITSPQQLGTDLYDNLQYGSICKASISVTITNEKTGTATDIGDVDVRYQLALDPSTGYTSISMAGPDVKEMSDEISELVRKQELAQQQARAKAMQSRSQQQNSVSRTELENQLLQIEEIANQNNKS